MEIALLVGLMLLLVMGTLASTGWDVFELRNRENWWWVSVLMLEALLMENKYAALLLGTVILGLWQIGRSWYILRMTVIPVAGCAGFYSLVTPHMKLWMIPYMLWAGVSIGLFLALWGVIGLRIKRRPFRLMFPWKQYGMWGIYEDQDKGLRYMCGQAHPCHLNSISALSMACAGGLLWLGQWWAAPALLACYLPQHLTWKSCGKGGQPHVGHLALIATGIAALALWNLQAGGLALGGCLIFASAVTIREQPWRQASAYGLGHGWWDSGRLSFWGDALRFCWWPFGWKARLFGFGTSTWFPRILGMAEARYKEVYTTAHNEFLQQLMEHGLIGLGLMLLYIGEGFWRNLHGAPEQQAVTLLIAAWCAIASVHFPATFYHEYHPATEKKEKWYGSPPLNVWTLMIAILAEAR